MTHERWLLVAAVVAWLVVAVIGIALGPPLGHDESAFAAAARGDAPPWLYRSTGVIAIAKVGIALGGADWAMRLASVVLGAGVVVAAWAVGRAAFDERIGAWAAAVVAGAHPMALRSAELIGDLPATACVLAGVALLVEELRLERGPGWRIIGVAPAFAAAFYLRYGSAPVIAIAGAAAAVLWWRAIVARPWPVIVAAALFGALLLPHAIQSLRATGSLLGILEVSAQMPRRAYVGEGLVTYVTSNPFLFYGALVAPVMVAGLVGVVRRPSRPAVFLGVVALGQVLAIGIKTHGQPRYVFVAAALLVVLGVAAIVRYASERRYAARIAIVLVALAWLGVAIAMVPFVRFLASERTPLVAAATAVRADAADRPCVIAAREVAQLMWYAGCDGFRARRDGPPPPPTDAREYVVSVPHATLDPAPIAAAHRATAVELPTADPRASAWRIDAVTVKPSTP